MGRVRIEADERDDQKLDIQIVLREEEASTLLLLDPDSLDSNMRYRFARNSPPRIARLKAKGYRYVTQEDGVRLLDQELVETSADGYIHVADTVLMCSPKEAVNKRRAARQKAQDTRLEANVEDFRRQSEAGGYPVIFQRGQK